MEWIPSLFGVSKPVIAMCHLAALPGDPFYDLEGGMEAVLERARSDMLALQNSGVDAILFSNESSLPYLTTVEPVTTACMARIIGELRRELQVPFGVNVLWDPRASLDLAAATGAVFVREIFSGVYASDFGLWNTHCGEVVRHQHRIHAGAVRLFFNIVPESAVYLTDRALEDIARSTVFNTRPDVLCISGLIAGAATPTDLIRRVKAVVPMTPVFANTGVKLSNLDEQLSAADGIIVGTAFKRDGQIWNEVDPQRVVEFMQTARTLRGE